MASYPYALTVVNPGAELGNTTGWTNSVGTLAAVGSLSGTSPHTGSFFFKAGVTDPTHCYQDVAVPSDAFTDVDGEGINCRLSLYQAGFTDADTGQPYLEFYNGSSVIIGVRKLGEVFNGAVNTWVQKQILFRVPALTRTIRIGFLGTRSVVTDTDAYFDDVTLQLEQSNLFRRRLGLVDYFLIGTKAFLAADWTGDGTSFFVDGGTLKLNIGLPGDNLHRGWYLNTAPDQNGGYINSRFLAFSTTNSLFGVGVVSDVTSGSLDMQGGRFQVRGFGGNTGPVELVNGAETVHGSDTANLARNLLHTVHAWVEPDSATPAAKTQYKTGTGGAVVQSDNGPLNTASITGKPGGFVYDGGGSMELSWFYAMLDRYVFVRGQTPGHVVKVRDSAGTMLYEATVDGDRVAAVDKFGQEAPLDSFDVIVLEADGVTPVDVIHPTDDPVVWGGDVFTPPLPAADFGLVATGLLANLTDRSVAYAIGATIVGWAYRYWLTSAPGSILGTSSAKKPAFALGAAGDYTFGLIATDSNGTESEEFTRAQAFGAGDTSPPYDLPTWKVAGRLLTRLDSINDYTGVDGVVIDTIGRPWLNWYKAPTPDEGRECRVKSVRRKDHADQPLRTLNASLTLTGKAGSISSGAFDGFLNLLSGSYSPALQGDREIISQKPLGDPDSTDPDDWKPRFHGYIDYHPASDSGNTVEIEARDVLQRLQIEYRGPQIWIGVEGGTITLPNAVQAILDATTRAGQWPLKTIGSLDWDMEAFALNGDIDDVLALISEMARQRGAVFRWRYDEDTERFQPTLFIQQVDKAEPDATYTNKQTIDIPQYGTDTKSSRNDLYLDYLGSDGKVHTLTRPPTQAEEEENGIKPLRIGTDKTRHIKDDVAGNLMLDYVDGAVRLPAVAGARILLTTDYDVEINSLLRFLPDPVITTSAIDGYVCGFEEVEEVSGEKVQESVAVSHRGAAAGELREFLKKVAGQAVSLPPKLPPTWTYLTRTTYDPIYDVYTGTVWCKIETHGLAVLLTQVQTKLPTSAWSMFGTPDRGPGDMSVVQARTLGIGEFEKDVPLDNDGALSSIRGEIVVEAIATPITLFEVNIDADNDPEVIAVNVKGPLDREVVADDDSLSVHVVKISGPGSSYSASDDSNLHEFAIPVPASSTWELEATSRNTLIADPDDKVSEPFPFTVTNTGEPTISLLVLPPDDGSGVMTIETTSSSQPAGYRARYLKRHTTAPIGGSPGEPTSWTDITPMMSPSPLVGGLPASPTTYDYSTGYVRNDADPEGEIAVEIKGEVLNASDVVVSDTGPYPYVEPWPYRIPT